MSKYQQLSNELSQYQVVQGQPINIIINQEQSDEQYQQSNIQQQKIQQQQQKNQQQFAQQIQGQQLPQNQQSNYQYPQQPNMNQMDLKQPIPLHLQPQIPINHQNNSNTQIPVGNHLFYAYPKQAQSRLSEQIYCQHCNRVVSTQVSYTVGKGAWFIGTLIACVAPYGCCLIPCLNNNFQDVTHLCPGCASILGQKKFIFEN